MAGQLLSARRQRRLIAIAAAICGVGPFVHGGFAQTTAEWINTSGGDWTDATSWSTNPVYPNGANYNALIDQAGTGPYSVNLENNITVGTLSLTTANATLNQTGGTLTANQVNVTAGTYQISGGILTGDTSYSTAYVSEVMTGPGGVFVNQGATLTNVVIIGTGSVVNNGTIASPLTGTSQSSADEYIRSNAVTNNGLIQVDNGQMDIGPRLGPFGTTPSIINSATGIINVNNASLAINGNWSNAGIITATNDAGLNDVGLTLAGDVTTAGMGTINVSPNEFVQIEAAIDNSGNTLTFSNANTLWFFGATVLNGTVAMGSNITVENSVFNGCTIDSLYLSVGQFEGDWSNQGAIHVGVAEPHFGLTLSGDSGPAGPSATMANAGTIMQTSGIVYPGAISGNGSLTVGNTAGGSAAAMSVPSLTQSSLTINATGSLAITGGTGNGVNTLVINAGGQLDLTSTSLAVNYAPGSDPAATIRGYLKSGYNNDTWTGPGIMSSTAAANPGLYAVGYADGNVDQGTAAAANQVLVEYTLAGDANLDGTVNFADLLVVAQNFNHTLDTHGNPIDWADGDFNYDGVVNFADLLLVAQNFNKKLSAGQLEQLPGSFAADWQLAEAEVQAGESDNVPEPAAISLLGIAAAGLMRRRRKSRGTGS